MSTTIHDPHSCWLGQGTGPRPDGTEPSCTGGDACVRVCDGCDEVAADCTCWSLGKFSAQVDAIHANPPAAPPGFELIECGAEPRHWPTYAAHVDGMYPAPCLYCISAGQDETIADLRHKAEHRRWQTWEVTAKASRILCLLGVANGRGTAWNSCPQCPVRHTIHWRGKRPYILGKPREWWHHVAHVRGHMPTLMRGWICSTCAPCPDCGSTDPSHEWCDR